MSSPAPGGRGEGDRSGTGRKAMLLRLDPEVHAALARWAADDLRSINAQVEWLLRRALAGAGRLPHAKVPAGRSRPDRAEEPTVGGGDPDVSPAAGGP